MQRREKTFADFNTKMCPPLITCLQNRLFQSNLLAEMSHKKGYETKRLLQIQDTVQIRLVGSQSGK